MARLTGGGYRQAERSLPQAQNPEPRLIFRLIPAADLPLAFKQPFMCLCVFLFNPEESAIQHQQQIPSSNVAPVAGLRTLSVVYRSFIINFVLCLSRSCSIPALSSSQHQDR